MKLILSSDGSFLLKYGYKLIGISKDQIRIGYITTAYQVSRNNFEFFENYKNKVRSEGYNLEEIDIKGKSEKEIKDFFKDKNVIHIEGGNTFYLLKAIQETGFDKILKDLLNEGKIYIGTSAGAYVACPTIEVANWNDDGKDKFGVTDFKAFNLVPFVLKVHYKNEKEEIVRKGIETLKYPIHILKDGQGILAEDDKYTFLGDGEEVILN
jgi:dipeptidase E